MGLFGSLKSNQQFEVERIFKKLMNESKSNKRKSEKETTMKQQLLILHYLGIIDSMNLSETTKKAKLLSVLLNRSEQNIRTELTYIDARKIEDSEMKTIENLNAILPVFEEVGLNEIVETIKADLGRLKID